MDIWESSSNDGGCVRDSGRALVREPLAWLRCAGEQEVDWCAGSASFLLAHHKRVRVSASSSRSSDQRGRTLLSHLPTIISVSSECGLMPALSVFFCSCNTVMFGHAFFEKGFLIGRSWCVNGYHKSTPRNRRLWWCRDLACGRALTERLMHCV